MSSAETIPEVSYGDENSQTSSEHEGIEKKNINQSRRKKRVVMAFFGISFIIVLAMAVTLMETIHDQQNTAYTGMYSNEKQLLINNINKYIKCIN